MKHYPVILTVLIGLILIPCAQAANVTDGPGSAAVSGGTTGQLLVNNGSGTGHQGTWTDVNDIAEIQTINGHLTTIDNTNTAQGTSISNLGSQVATINGHLTVIDSTNSAQDASLTSLTGQVSGLNATSAQHTTAISSLQATDLVHSSSITSLTGAVNNQTSVNDRQDRDISNVNSRVDDVSNRVANLEKTQVIVGLEGRIYDGKKWQVNTFIDGNTTRSKVDRVGVRFTYKFGKSYEEKRLDELQARLDKLEGIKAQEEKESSYEVYPTQNGFGMRTKF